MASSDIFFKYFDIGEVINHYYANKKTIGLEKYNLEIEEWLKTPLLNPKENKPLVIAAEEGSGRKTLLVKFIEYYKQNNKNTYPLEDIILTHFATSCEKNANYFYAIYRILVQLRNKLNVKQRVELLEDKLRKYFGYWLGVCTRKIQKKVIKQKISENSLIIIIIDRIDMFIDPQISQEANVAFWLPKNLPEKVRIIATCQKNCEVYNYFINNGSRVIHLTKRASITSFMLDYHKERKTFTNEIHNKEIINILDGFDARLKNDCKFVKTYLTAFIPYPDEKWNGNYDKTKEIFNKIMNNLDKNKLKLITGREELKKTILLFFENQIIPTEKFKKLMLVLSLTHKGILENEILQLIKIKKEEWDLLFIIFKGFIYEYNGLYSINDLVFKSVLSLIYTPEITTINSLHEEISEVLESNSISIRKLEEQTFHLYSSSSYFKLKETVSIIENFLLLFNPDNKYDLCHYWQTLLMNGFDPAVEYNKAIEGFEMHYKPTAEDIFRIILQVSRFLKEFSDFETDETPIFRHPPIIGSIDLNKIGLKKEIINVKMHKLPDLNRNHDILTEIEGKNLEKEGNYEEFRHFFLEKINNKLNSKKLFDNEETSVNISKFAENKFLPIKSSIFAKELNSEESEESEEFSNENDDMQAYRKLKDELFNTKNENNPSLSLKKEIYAIKKEKTVEKTYKVKKEENNKNKKGNKNENNSGNEKYDTSLDEEYIVPNSEHTYYYYKRWLWMIFPWACMSQNKHCIFSDQIIKSFSSATKYMSVIQEEKYTKNALKIALEAKLKKKMIYGKKEEIDQELKTLKNMQNEVGILNQMEKSIIKNNRSVETGSKLKKNSKIILNPLNNQIQPNTSTPNFFLTESIKPCIVPTIYQKSSTLLILNKNKFQKERFTMYKEGETLLTGMNLQQKSLKILPKLKESINEHNKGALKVLENQINELKKDFNEIAFENKRLEKKLFQLKINENIHIKNQAEIDTINLRERVLFLEEKSNNNMNSFQNTQNEKERFEIILTICKKNRQQNQDYIRDLNYLLTNFKKCIRKELDLIRSKKLEALTIKKLASKYIENTENKLQNNVNMIAEIKKNLTNKIKFDESYVETNRLIRESATQSMSQMKFNYDKSKKLDDKKDNLAIKTEKNTKILVEKLEYYKDQFNKIAELLKEDEDITISPNYKLFFASLEKKYEMIAQNYGKSDHIDLLKEIIDSKKNVLETLQRKNGKSIQSIEEPGNELQKNDYLRKMVDLEKEHEKKCREFIHLKNSELNSLMILNTIQEQLEIKEKNKLNEINGIEISEKIDIYLNVIKTKLTNEEYELFEKDKFDITKLMTRFIPKDLSSLIENKELE